MVGMFREAETFNGDVSKWNVSNMSANYFNGDISEWDVQRTGFARG